jgi:CMP-N-acetylneuraminic acid synthetase
MKIHSFKQNQKTMKHTLMLQSSITIREIDICVNEIQKFLRSIVEMIVSWTIFNRHVKSFWNEQCNATIKNMRKLRRLWSASRNSHDLTFYIKINDRKQKIIQKTKRVNFRQKIEKIFETLTNLWRFVKWAKNKNH